VNADPHTIIIWRHITFSIRYYFNDESKLLKFEK